MITFGQDLGETDKWWGFSEAARYEAEDEMSVENVQ